MEVKELAERIIKESDIITKSFDINVTDLSNIDKGEMEFWCSAKSYDQVNDRVLNIEPLESIELLYGHNTKDVNQWLGSARNFKYGNDNRLYSKAIFNTSPSGQLVRQILKDGGRGKFSISFYPLDYERNDKDGYDFKMVRLTEVSLVPSPCHLDTGVVSVKSLEPKEEKPKEIDTYEEQRIKELTVIRNLLRDKPEEFKALVRAKLSGNDNL